MIVISQRIWAVVILENNGIYFIVILYQLDKAASRHQIPRIVFLFFLFANIENTNNLFLNLSLAGRF